MKLQLICRSFGAGKYSLRKGHTQLLIPWRFSTFPSLILQKQNNAEKTTKKKEKKWRDSCQFITENETFSAGLVVCLQLPLLLLLLLLYYYYYYYYCCCFVSCNFYHNCGQHYDIGKRQAKRNLNIITTICCLVFDNNSNSKQQQRHRAKRSRGDDCCHG